MDVYTVASCVRPGDLCDSAIDTAGRDRFRLDRHDGAFWDRLDSGGPADVDVMPAAISAINDEIMTIIELVRQATVHDASHKRLGFWLGRIVTGDVRH